MHWPETSYAQYRCDGCDARGQVPMALIAEPFACVACGRADAFTPAQIAAFEAAFVLALAAAVEERERLGAAVRAEVMPHTNGIDVWPIEGSKRTP